MFDPLFQNEKFVARWDSGAGWSDQPWLAWVHILADLATATAYIAIPVLMLVALRRQRHLPAPRLLLLFAIFILACGSVHFFEALVFWSPLYYTAAVAKTVTAVLSCTTAVVLAFYWPKLLQYRSPEQLQREVDLQTERLEEANNRLALALSAGAMGAWEWDLETNLVRLDKTELALTELTPTDQTEDGHGLFHVEDFLAQVHPQDRPGLQDALDATVHRGLPYAHAFRMLLPRGRERWLSGRGRLVEEKGENRRMVGVNFDITSQKNFERDLAEARIQAESANRAKSRFLANTSHEIRTPLTAILGCADMLAREVSDGSTLETVSLIQRQGKLLQRLLDDVLDLSKIEAGRLSVRKKNLCDVHALAEDVRSIMQPMALEKGLRFEMNLAEKTPRLLQTDPIRLRQVLVNLVSNAIKFTDRGSVEIAVMRDDDPDKPVVFLVTDTGLGIPRHEQTAVFDSFHQVHDATLRGDQTHSVNSGAGLGLAISAKLTRMLGGDIDLDSEPGRGSTFRVRLPLIEPTEEQVAAFRNRTARPQSPNGDGAPIARGSMLVAEDTPSIQFLLKRLLAPHATTLDFVGDGRDAVDRVEAALADGAPYDLVLLDMNMPVMSGYDAARQLREAGVTTPIIALTASAMVGDRQRCLDAGCDAYVPKPINWAELEREVQLALAGGNAGE